MKNIILMLWAACMAFAGMAQGFYDNINLGASDIGNFCYLKDNWKTTHGSPDYNGNNNTFYMWNAGMYGEGLCRMIDIPSNTAYKLELGVDSFLFDNINSTGEIRIALVKDFTQNCNFGGGGALLPNLYGNQLIYTYNSQILSDSELEVQFTSDANGPYKGIVIMPKLTQGGGAVRLTIDYLNLLPCNSQADKYYYRSTITPGEYDQRYAYIGSSYGSTATQTRFDPGDSTKIHAREAIIIKDNTVLSLNEWGWGFIELDIIKPCTTTVIPNKSAAVDLNENDFVSEQPAVDAIAWQLFPNPASNRLNITYNLPQVSDVSVRVFDLSGRNVMNKSVQNQPQGDQRMDIDVSGLPAGTYLLQLGTANLNETKRFIISR